MVNNPPANAGDTIDPGSIPGSGRSPGGGNGNPLLDSCLGNPMDRGAWRATVHGAAESQTLKPLSGHTSDTVTTWKHRQTGNLSVTGSGILRGRTQRDWGRRPPWSHLGSKDGAQEAMKRRRGRQ